MLEARKIDASGGRLTAEVRGEIEKEEGVLVIRRIHAHYTVRAAELDEAQRVSLERAHALHADRCPVARSLKGAVEITTSYEIAV